MLPFLFLLFPYANEKRCERVPVVTYAVIILNILFYAANWWGIKKGYGHLFEQIAYEPGKSPWYTLLTYSFAHVGIFHIGFNMWFFYLVAGQVEERMGSWLFGLFYLGGALACSFAYLVYAGLVEDARGMVGASGAVYAVMGAYFILYPFEEFRFWYFVLYRWGTIKIATLFFIGYKVIGDAMNAWLQVKYGAISNVAHWGHLGGVLFGAAVALAAFGSYPFTGKKRLSHNEKMLRRLFRRRARRKFYSDAPLPEPMTEEEFQAATEDCTPREAIRRGIFFHNGRMIEWGYQELLFENPRTCLEPTIQLQMIEMLRVHGRDSLAEVACWNLLETHPDSPEAVQVRLELGRALARLPEMHGKAAALLREFLKCEPAARERIEAERLLRKLEERPLWQWKGRQNSPET